MRFLAGTFPTSPDFVPDGSWKSLREPGPWLVQLIALPIGALATATVLFFWLTTTPLAEAALRTKFWFFFWFFRPLGGVKLPITLWVFFPVLFVLIVGVIVIHELVHAAAHPDGGRSPHSLLGFWPSRLILYAYYDREVTRNRFVAILLMPVLVITVLPLLIAGLTQMSSGWLAFASSFNAILSCADILGAGLVLFQIPPRAVVRNKGWSTHWTTPATA